MLPLCVDEGFGAIPWSPLARAGPARHRARWRLTPVSLTPVSLTSARS